MFARQWDHITTIWLAHGLRTLWRATLNHRLHLWQMKWRSTVPTVEGSINRKFLDAVGTLAGWCAHVILMEATRALLRRQDYSGEDAPQIRADKYFSMIERY